MTVKIVAIDYSISCPAICVGSFESEDFNDCEFFFHYDGGSKPSKKKLAKLEEDKLNIKASFAPLYTHEMERYNNIASWVHKVAIKDRTVDSVWVEGYSMGSKGNVTAICENGGILKHSLWQGGIPYNMIAPSSIKKFFSGKGNANKTIMYDAFLERTGIDIAALYELKPDENPISDIVDAYAIFLYGYSLTNSL